MLFVAWTASWVNDTIRLAHDIAYIQIEKNYTYI